VAARGTFRGRAIPRGQLPPKRLQFGEPTHLPLAVPVSLPQFQDQKYKGDSDFTGSER